ARKCIEEFVREHVPPDADGQVRRAVHRFAIVAAAGELATEWGITGWPAGEAEEATRRLFADWLRERGGSEAAEISAGIAAVRTFLDRHGASRFAVLDGPEEQIIDRAGFREKGKDGTTFYVLPTVWRDQILVGHDAAHVAAEM